MTCCGKGPFSDGDQAMGMTPTQIVELLREQFAKKGHQLQMGRPEDGGDMSAVYERYADGDTPLWARFDSSSDAEAVVTAINAACHDGDGESAWLIEIPGGAPTWWDGERFTPYSLKAVRFSRRADAERAVLAVDDGDRDFCIVTEHVWEEVARG